MPEMALPLCVRTEKRDQRDVLLSDGWRCVGRLVTFKKPYAMFDGPKFHWCANEKDGAHNVVEEIDWKGRLFRDKAVEKADAFAYIHKIIDDEKNDVLCQQGFLLVSREISLTQRRIVLLGKYDSACRITDVLCSVPYNTVAGTYHDNVSAVWAYLDSGFKPTTKQWVLHK